MIRRSYVLLALGIVLSLGPRSQAALFDSGSFESPTYVAGELNGQHSWSASTEFEIESVTSNANTGDQYLVTSGSAGSIGATRDFTAALAGEVPAQAFFWMDSGVQWIDVQLRDGDDNTSFAAIGFQNGVNGFNHNIVYRDSTDLTGAYIAIGTYTPDEYFEIDVVSDITNGTYDVFLNNALIGNDLPQRQPVADSLGRITINAEPSLAGFRVDDLVIGVVPEPSSFGLLGAGLLGLARVRRKRAPCELVAAD